MSDETKTETVVETQVAELSANDIRSNELFIKQAKLASSYKAKLEQYENNQKQAEVEAQTKVLEEKGQYDLLLQQREQEFAKLRTSFEQDLTKEKLTNALLLKGVNNKVALKLALVDYDYETGIDGISEFVDSFMTNEDHQIFFQTQEQPMGKPGPSPVNPSQTSSENLEQRLKAGDKEAQRATFERLMKG